MSSKIRPDDLREALKNYLTARNSTESKIAKSLGFSQAVLNLWLKDKYTGDNNKVADSVKTFLERQNEILIANFTEIPFLMISPAERIFSIAKKCHIRHEIGVFTSPAGTGKTKAVKEYAKRNSDTILIEADLGYTVKVLFQELHRVLGLDGNGPLHDLFEKVIDKLSDTSRMIIVDEAEKLPVKALDLIRRVNDKAKIGILLTGLPRLVHNLRGFKGEFAYLYSRVGITDTIDHLSNEDVELIVKDIFPGSNESVCKYFNVKSLGNARRLEKLIFRSREILELNPGLELSEDVINSAHQLIIK